jgi:hypothetical protein
VRLIFRPLAPREFDHELVWLSVSLGGLVIAAIWMKFLPWPFCIFHALTGEPCLTCGATRSAIAFFHGNFPTAFAWNPLVFATYIGITIFDIYAFVTVVLRTRRLRVVGVTQSERSFVRWTAIAAAVLNWGYLLLNSGRFA